MRVHAREKPFYCGLFTESFTETDDRKEHMRMQTIERQLSFEWFAKQCLKNYDLEKHMRVHAEEKPFYYGQ